MKDDIEKCRYCRQWFGMHSASCTRLGARVKKCERCGVVRLDALPGSITCVNCAKALENVQVREIE